MPGMHLFKKLLSLVLLLTITVSISRATEGESYIQSLSGHIKKGDSCTVVDDKFLNLSLEYWNLIRNLSVENLITFELRQDTNIYYYDRPFTCTLNFSVHYFATRDQLKPTEVNNLSLVVKYDTATGKFYPVYDRYAFKNAFKVIVIVNSIESKEWGDKLPAIFRIKNQIMVKRKYPYSREVNAKLGMSLSGNMQESSVYRVNPGTPVDNHLTITWDANDFTNFSNGFGTPEEYDLEWSYIDSRSERAISFANNSVTPGMVEEFMRFDNSRITISGVSYKIHLAYGDGYIVTRVRGAWNDDISGVRQTTNWQYLNSSDQVAFTAIGFHEQNLNWQYSVSFAEEGKRKDVISYFDGSLRNRQAVTINNSDDIAIIAETIYDNMGRPAMAILPAPVNNNVLKYYPAENNNGAGQPYSHTDITPDSCTIDAAGLNTVAGAARYYSPNNAFIGDPDYYFTKYVPNSVAGAEQRGYPFSLTEFTPDNTNRIRRQGGTGYDFRIGGNHETNYFYGKPLQSELDRLFGMEAGISSHYLKNMTVDPNGQVSVSYINASGKTIATALAGVAPGNLDELPSAQTPEARKTMLQVLMRSSDFQSNTSTLSKQASARFLVAVKNVPVTVLYSASPSSFGPWNGPTAGQQFCSNCYYDIEVTVKNDCGEIVATANTPAFAGNLMSCANVPAFTDSVTFTPEKYGEYTVTYRLRLSEDVIKEQTDYYITNNIDLKTLLKFFEEELYQNNILGCYSDCETCKKLGDSLSFVQKVKNMMIKIRDEKYPLTQYPNFDVNSPDINTWIAGQYTSIKANCTLLAADCVPSPCEQKLEMMKYDVRPGGQYALISYNETNGQYSIIDDSTNVLVKYDDGITEIDNLTYEDDNGNTVHIKENGQYISVSKFIEEYIKHPEWADAFVKLHIEYCSYLWCKDASNPNANFRNEVSYKFDEKLREIITKGQDAVNAGYYSDFNHAQIADLDPFFNGGRGTPYKAQLISDLDALSAVLRVTFRDQSGNYMPVKNIRQLVEWELYCKPTSEFATASDFLNSWNCTPPSASCRSLTGEWQLYRNYYLKIKSKYVRLAKLAYDPSCENCFIGQDVLAAAVCEDPGPVSDYSFTGGMISKRVVYKNGTEAFKGNYIITLRYTPNNALQTINAVKGTFQTEIIPNIYGDPIFEIVSVKCANSNPIQSCNDDSSGGGGEEPPPCPQQSEFELQYRQCSINDNGGVWWDECQVFLVRTAGPVDQTVVVNIRQDEEYQNYPPSHNTSYFDAILNPGQQEVYVGSSYDVVTPPPFPQYYLIYRHYGIEGVSCPPPVCPDETDFYYYDDNLGAMSTEHCPKQEAYYNDKYFVHTAGVVSQPVTVKIREVIYNFPNTTVNYRWETIQTGQDRVFLGQTRYEWIDANCDWLQDDTEITTYNYYVDSVYCPPSGFTCPQPGDFAVDYNSQGCLSDGNMLIVSYIGSSPSLPFPPNKKITVTCFVSTSSGSFVTTVVINNYSGTGSTCVGGKGITINSVTITGVECVDIATPPPSSCPDDPRAPRYSKKIRIFNEYVDEQGYLDCLTSNGPTTQAGSDAISAAAIAAMRQQAIENLDALKPNWIETFKGARDEEFPGLATTSLSDAVINSLADNLYLVAKKYIEIAPKENIRAASTLPPGQVASNGYHNFTEVFTAIIGTTLMQQGFGPHLLAQPYPYDKTPIPAGPNGLTIPPDACSRLSALKTRWQNAGSPGTFHSYLKNELKEDFVLTVAELTDLENRCANNCKLLNDPLSLPAIFATPVPSNPDHPWVDCNRITTLYNSFAATYPNVAADTKLHRNLLGNFMNASLGYALTYYDYEEFKNITCVSTPTALLYNKPASPTIVSDNELVCIDNILRNVFDKAGQEYEIYIEIERRKFRNGYISKCLSNNVSAKLRSEQYEYHYTLYYYDQSGNLVKTIPPEGVALLSDAELELVEEFRPDDPAVCTGAGIPTSENATATFNALSTALDNGTTHGTEMWLYNGAPGSTRHVRIITPDDKYFYQAAIHEDKLWVEMYSLQVSGPGLISIVLANKAVADVSALPPLQAWSHLQIQSAGSLTSGTLQLYLDGRKLTNMTGTLPPYPFEWAIISEPGSYTLPALELSELKHLRIYDRTATDAEVWANYKNSCLSPVGALAVQSSPLQFWGRFNIPAYCSANDPDDAREIVNNGSLQITGTGPGVNLQTVASVANNFTVEMWVKPQVPHEVDTEAQSGYGGISGQKYAIYPTYGDLYSTTTAGMGISVGTNGVSVYEHANSYMPALLVWSGTLSGWNHIAVVYQDKMPFLYVNGQLVKVGLQSLKQTVHPSYNFGGGDAMYGAFTNGQIDEVRIWDGARTAQQISANYNKGLLPGTSPSLVGYWPMSASDVTNINDVTCNNLDLALVSNEQWSTNTSPVKDLTIVEYASRFVVPDHMLPTNYAYNSLNQVTKQSSPDAGTSEFYYDRLGRMTISQNAEQKTPKIIDSENPANRFGYTRYDALGRIVEVGEKLSAGNMTETDTRDDIFLAAWFASGTNRQVTVTAYDVQPTWAPASLTGTQKNLRKRVAASAILSVASPATNPSLNRIAASYFSYDMIGNVNVLVQENTELSNTEAQFISGATGLKTLKYDYDLASGRIRKLLYQDGKWDQFYYQYLYDADNRVVKALSSRNNFNDVNLWVTEASYRYYLHGPLARMELGNVKVQGVDYAYTLQGWLKGVNSQFLDPAKDMSGDGQIGNNNYFEDHARDVFGFSLGYYNKDNSLNIQGDYSPIGGATAPAFGLQYTPPVADPGNRNFETGKSLFNGNISHATYAIKPLENSSTVAYSYRYDQLNRLTGMRRHNITAGSTAWNNTSIIDAYKEEISYDANGNIKTYQRNGANQPGMLLEMDNLAYEYNVDNNGRLVNNKLRHVNDDLAHSSNYTEDIDNQGSDNYDYDNIGNLISDSAEKIEKIDWTIYGKISHIFRNNVTASEFMIVGTTTDITYKYDAAGNRISKSVTRQIFSEAAPPPPDTKNTFYVRDAQGNVLAVYTNTPDNGMQIGSYSWSEQHLYGSARLGMVTPNFTIGGELSGPPPPANDQYNPVDDPVTNGIAGLRLYELTNHLGNVFVTINDIKTGVDIQPDGTTDYYVATVLTAHDYYPFGMIMPGRDYTAAGSYRYGFNGKENDNDVKDIEGSQQDYGMRIYDPRLGRFLSVDPLKGQFPSYTPYQFAGNRPIYALDLDGAEELDFKKFSEGMVLGATKFFNSEWPESIPGDELRFKLKLAPDNQFFTTDGKTYKLKDNKTPSQGLNDIFNNPGQYAMDCQLFVQITKLYGMMYSMGEEKFDEYIKGGSKNFIIDISFSTGIQEKTVYYPFDREKGTFQGNDATDIVDGWQFVENAPAGTEIALQSNFLAGTAYRIENVVKTGKDKYLALGLGEKELSMAELKKALSDKADKTVDRTKEIQIAEIRVSSETEKKQ